LAGKPSEPPPPAPRPSECISEPQGKRLYAILQKGAADQAAREARTALLKDYMQATIGHAESGKIRRGREYDAICAEAARISGAQL
jgi:hypothetical protein